MIDRIYDTPWKLLNKAESLLIYPWVRMLFLMNAIQWGTGWQFYGAPIVLKHRQSTMRFGKQLQLRSSMKSNPLGPNHAVILSTWQKGALLEVGDNFAMTGGTLCAAGQIKIGNNVAIGANTTISDTDFHPLDVDSRRINPSQGRIAPVCIEDDVFIGMNCIILKGVSIGRGSVIGAGSVVSRDVPAGVIAAGNPAVVIRTILP